jgi:cell division protein FtsB
MALTDSIGPLARKFRTILLGIGLGLVAVWVLFFDSHSIATRIQLMAERSELTADNEALQARIDALEVKLSAPPSDAEIERISREDYHMSRPGETVYPVITEQ